MQASDLPEKLVEAFAAAASGNYVRDIPKADPGGGAASLDLGFPPSTFMPTASGGTYMDGRDLNGILKLVSAWSRWAGAGGTVVYDNAFATAIGGYPTGALLRSTASGFWYNTTDSNTSNPDGGGAGWFRLGYLTQRGTLTLPASGQTSASASVSFAAAFPNGCDMVSLTPQGLANSTQFCTPIMRAVWTGSGFTAYGDTNTGGQGLQVTFNQTVPVAWEAHGH